MSLKLFLGFPFSAPYPLPKAAATSHAAPPTPVLLLEHDPPALLHRVRMRLAGASGVPARPREYLRDCEVHHRQELRARAPSLLDRLARLLRAASPQAQPCLLAHQIRTLGPEFQPPSLLRLRLPPHPDQRLRRCIPKTRARSSSSRNRGCFLPMMCKLARYVTCIKSQAPRAFAHLSLRH
jgi:hypothetical protein